MNITNEVQHMNNSYILGGVSILGLLILFARCITNNTQNQSDKPICMSTQEAISYNTCSLQLLPIASYCVQHLHHLHAFSCDSEDSKMVESAI